MCYDPNCSAWAQRGWVKHQSYSSPKGYCEFKAVGQTPIKFHYSISAATHTYMTKKRDGSNTIWDCYSDGQWKAEWLVNFSQGTDMPVQGEVSSIDTQIGRNAPARLTFTNMVYRHAVTLGWLQLNIVLIPPDSPYGNAEPTAGQFENWTNAH